MPDEEETLPEGVLPNVTDTDPPPIHPDTVAGPPVCETTPYASLEGGKLSCTMGTWQNDPESYAYQWQIAGEDVGDNAPTYTPAPGDAGKAATCIVIASNDLGSTAAPPSNAVSIPKE